MGVAIPSAVRLVAFDDVKYANLITVPLTTIRQPCLELGAAAVNTMVQRIQNPGVPARDVLVDFELVVRDSSGLRSKLSS